MSTTDTLTLSSEVARFFSNNPTRRYFVKVLDGSTDNSFCKLFIVPNEPSAHYGVAIDWHVEQNRTSLTELARWFNFDPYAEMLIEALLPGSDQAPSDGLTSSPEKSNFLMKNRLPMH
jgi:hypothetical protein